MHTPNDRVDSSGEEGNVWSLAKASIISSEFNFGANGLAGTRGLLDATEGDTTQHPEIILKPTRVID
ncbi:hypothetical protein RUM44_008192 [Polyplax serrata]|uniref:Uncharacterized protein n=1 Tax=Polyplax serrata TaxID=468196 RepID=A0ABR1B9M8_POLSC